MFIIQKAFADKFFKTKMNLDSAKVTSEEKVDLCKKYFYVGCLFLPFIWGVNAVWFYKEAFIKPQFPGQSTIRKLVIASFLGALIWTIGLVTWMTIFTLNRAEWGAFADRISFNIPIGKP